MAGLSTPYKSTLKKNTSRSILPAYNTNQLLIDANKKLGADVYKVPTTTTTKKNTSKGTVTDKKSTVTIRKPLQSYSGSGSGSSGDGGVSVASSYAATVKPYLDEMLAAYRQGADANKALAKATYDAKVNNLNSVLRQAEEDYASTESDLLTSLKRYQEQNAKDVENQKRAYLIDQAALETARLEADRQTRIDAAARGLGGSGLQQLAQLQNLINQGQEISDLATGNQNVLEDLRTQLAEQTEDIDTKKEKARKVLEAARTANQTGLTDLLNAYNAEVKGIDANLANQLANANYTYGQDLYSANQSAAAQAASSGANDSINAMLSYLQDDLSNNLSSLNTASTKTLKELRKQYGLGTDATKTDIAKAMTNTTLGYGANTGLNTSQYNTFNNNLNTILKNANIQNDKSWWEKLTGK